MKQWYVTKLITELGNQAQSCCSPLSWCIQQPQTVPFPSAEGGSPPVPVSLWVWVATWGHSPRNLNLCMRMNPVSHRHPSLGYQKTYGQESNRYPLLLKPGVEQLQLCEASCRNHSWRKMAEAMRRSQVISKYIHFLLYLKVVIVFTMLTVSWRMTDNKMTIIIRWVVSSIIAAQRRNGYSV